MAGSQDNFQQTITSLEHQVSTFQSSLQEFDSLELFFLQRHSDLLSLTLQLRDVTSKLRLSPETTQISHRMSQMFQSLSKHSGITVTNLDFSGEFPVFLSGLNQDGSMTLKLEVDLMKSGMKVIYLEVEIDKDAYMRGIRVLETVLGQLKDTSSEVTAEIQAALELQSLGCLIRKLKSRMGR